MRNHFIIRLGVLLALGCAPLLAQEQASKQGPAITMSPAPLTTAPRGKVTGVDLHFQVARGFHVNSNTPSEEYLIPTVLKLDVPTDIVIGRTVYPPGQDASFSFAPDQKLNVYTGDFAVTVEVHPLVGMSPGEYVVHGQLRYQACDNAACYPPKRLPVQFEIKVVKGPRGPVKNPAQSPHVHS